jgi:predicted nucleic acid-binding protein
MSTHSRSINLRAQPTERHANLLDELLALAGVHANLVPDAHLAALALEHGLTLCSTVGISRDFRHYAY